MCISVCVCVCVCEWVYWRKHAVELIREHCVCVCVCVCSVLNRGSSHRKFSLHCYRSSVHSWCRVSASSPASVWITSIAGSSGASWFMCDANVQCQRRKLCVLYVETVLEVTGGGVLCVWLMPETWVCIFFCFICLNVTVQHSGFTRV